MSDLDSHRRAPTKLSVAWAERLEIGGSMLLLAATIWVARYWLSAGFGLYEDDLSNIPYGVQLTAASWWQYTLSSLAHLGWSGKPLHLPLIYLFSNIGFHLAGLRGAYLLGFMILTANTWLMYALLRRLGGQALALAGGLAYCLFSADTTQAFLTHSFGLQPSMTFLLLGFHAYLSDRRLLSYVFFFGTLMTYETVFPVALAAPLLGLEAGPKARRLLLMHGVVLAVILGGVAGARLVVGDRRVAGLQFPQVITTPIIHMVEGPFVSLGSYVYRPIQAIRGATVISVIVMLVAAASFGWAFSRVKLTKSVDISSSWRVARAAGSSVSGIWAKINAGMAALPAPARQWLRLLIAGLVMIVLAYPLTFTVRAYAISGRDTRVHFAAVAGASLVIGCLTLAVLSAAEAIGHKKLVAAVLAALFGLMLGYGFVIQKDYVLAWQYQRTFWTQIVPLVPDVQDGSAVLVDPSGLLDTRQIGANYWNMPRVLSQIFQFPADWNPPPRVYRMTPDWRDHILSAEALFQLDGTTTVAPPSTYQAANPGNVILLEWDGGEWARSAAPLRLSQSMVNLKPMPAPQSPVYPHGFLYPLLIESKAAGG